MLRPILYLLGLVALIVLCIRVALNLLPSGATQVDRKVIELESRCELQLESCRLTLPDGQLELNFGPKSLPVLVPLTLSLHPLESNPLEINELVAWFDGKDMDMGRHFFQTSSLSKGAYNLKGMIPVCTIDSEMIWTLSIEFNAGESRYRYRFDLKSIHE